MTNFEKFEEKNSKKFQGVQLIIDPTFFSKLYFDPNYGDTGTVYNDKSPFLVILTHILVKGKH